MDHLPNAEEIIKQAWDEYLFQKHSSKFLEWYRAGVEESHTKESDNRMAIDTAIENYPKSKDNKVLSQPRSKLIKIQRRH